MGDPQALSFDHRVPVEEHVEIDHSGTPPLPTLPTCRSLDVEASVQQGSGAEYRIEDYHRIEKVGLIRTDRSRLPDR